MTVYLVICLPKNQHIHRIYMVLANPTYKKTFSSYIMLNLISSPLMTPMATPPNQFTLLVHRASSVVRRRLNIMLS